MRVGVPVVEVEHDHRHDDRDGAHDHDARKVYSYKVKKHVGALLSQNNNVRSNIVFFSGSL